MTVLKPLRRRLTVLAKSLLLFGITLFAVAPAAAQESPNETAAAVSESSEQVAEQAEPAEPAAEPATQGPVTGEDPAPPEQPAVESTDATEIDLPADEPAGANGDDSLKADAAEPEGDAAAEDLEEPAVEEEPGIDWWGVMERSPPFLALTHHAAVHLPIALWLLGALFVLIGVVVPSWRNQVPLACLIGGAISSVAAAASGWWYAEYEYGDGWDWETSLGDIDWSDLLTQHRYTGVALVFASLGLSVVALVSQARQSRGLGFVWRVGLLLLAAAVAWEGHIGGELIMGEGFLEEAFEKLLNPEAE